MSPCPERKEQGHEIVTRFLRPAVPERLYDWQAFRAGAEPGDPMGWGKTEFEAVADLQTAEDEASENGLLPDVMETIRRARKRMRLLNGASDAVCGQIAWAELNKILAAYDREQRP